MEERLQYFRLPLMLQEGKFHTDPHPGNIFVRENRTIILIDLGMVREIRKQDTLFVHELVEGITLDSYDKVISALEKLCFLLSHADKEALKQANLHIYKAGFGFYG